MVSGKTSPTNSQLSLARRHLRGENVLLSEAGVSAQSVFGGINVQDPFFRRSARRALLTRRKEARQPK